MPILKVSLGIGYCNANREDELEISDMEWDSCKDDKERNDLMYQYWKDWSTNYIDGGYDIKED